MPPKELAAQRLQRCLQRLQRSWQRLQRLPRSLQKVPKAFAKVSKDLATVAKVLASPCASLASLARPCKGLAKRLQGACKGSLQRVLTYLPRLCDRGSVHTLHPSSPRWGWGVQGSTLRPRLHHDRCVAVEHVGRAFFGGSPPLQGWEGGKPENGFLSPKWPRMAIHTDSTPHLLFNAVRYEYRH